MNDGRELLSQKNPVKLVSIGSISSASLLVQGFGTQRANLTAIVPTTDTGSSTGLIRARFGIPAPGDLRAVLSAMGGGEQTQMFLRRLFEYRFQSAHLPELPNLALGNLVLAALTDMLGSFSQAVEVAAAILGVKGRVLPATSENTHLVAILESGEKIRGEKEVRRPGKSSIQRLFLEDPETKPTPGIAEALAGADMIILGPGCLYTSLIACLVVPGFPEILRQVFAPKIFCCNTTTTPGQTDGLGVFEHVELITRYLGGAPPDYVLINAEKPSAQIVADYESDGVYMLLSTPIELEKIQAIGITPILADLIETNWAGKRTLHKIDTIRHDPTKVSAILAALLKGSGAVLTPQTSPAGGK